MRMVTIDDVCTFVGGSQPPKSTFIYEEKEGYIRLIQTRDYKTDRFITYIPEATAKKKCSAQDVMIGRYGPPIFQILRGLEGAYNVALMKACPKDVILNDYLYYLLKQKNLFLYIDSLSSRTGGQTGVDIPSLKKYPVYLPEKPYQEKVVKILKGIDDKIDTNNKIRKKAEDLLWEMWLHEFAKNANSYKENNLLEICTHATDSINPFDSPSKEYIYYNIPTFDETGAYTIEVGANIKSNKFLVKDTDVLVSKLNPWFNRVILADRTAICSTEFVVLRTANRYLRNFLYVICTSQPFIGYCSTNATGTSNSHKRISPELMLDFKANFSLQAAEDFGRKVDPYISMIINIVNQNLSLSSTRDFLLPMLMSGQVAISDSTPNAHILEFNNQEHKQYDVRQAARSFGENSTDDTADLVKEFIKRRKNDSKS